MEEPLRIAVCEDTKADEEKLISVIRECATPTLCTVFQSGEALLEAYRPQEYDLILTDIYMTGMTGVEAVSRIREMDAEVPVAFITTSKDFALEGYRLSVLKYIEKPYQKKDIESMLRLALMERDSAPALSFRRNGQEERLRYSQIAYLEQQTHQLNICTRSGESVRIYEKLSDCMPELSRHGFFMPHKSFAVNIACVRYIDAELRCFVMNDGKNIPIRRESVGKAKKALEEYLFSRTRGFLHEK